MRTLIADDDFISRNMIHAILLPYGKSDIAVNGREAVEAFESAWQEKRPYDMIFLDVRMPEMDGRETLKEIREREKVMDIPEDRAVKVVMVTSARDAATVKSVYEARCDSYLVKPVERDRLLDEINRLKTSANEGKNGQ
jgi:two-component system, chemotaxis family, chemotaxis protein CheY